MSKLVITYDLFRNATLGVPSVGSNAQWLYGLSRISAAPIFTDVQLLGARSDGGTFDTLAVAKELDLPLTPESWALLSSYGSRGGYLTRHLEQLLHGVSGVIGFGLPPSLMQVLDSLGLVFIDVELSQIRFIKSVAFRARTNSPQLQSYFKSISIDREHYVEQAQNVFSKGFRNSKFKNCNVGLFFGQTEVDLALVQDGRLVKTSDHDVLSSIRELTGDLEELHVIQHPNQRSRYGSLVPLLTRIPHSILSKAGGYAALTEYSGARCISLSSGMLAEAAILGHATHALIRPDCDNKELLPQSLGDWIDVDDRVLGSLSMELLRGDTLSNATPEDRRISVVGTISEDPVIRSDSFDVVPRLIVGYGPITFVEEGFHETLLQAGWHRCESWGVWSSDNLACIAFRMDEIGLAKMVLRGTLFSVNAGDFICRPVFSCHLKTADQIKVVDVHFDDDFWVVETELEVFTSQQLVILVFSIAGASSPTDLGVGLDARKLGIGLVSLSVERTMAFDDGSRELRVAPDRHYYELLHASMSAYQDNNWLVPYASFIISFGFDTVVECAAGNGAFADALSPFVDRYVALDWAPSPLFPFSSPNVFFKVWDAYVDEVLNGDLVCSADFFEHLEDSCLDSILRRVLSAAPKHFHIVACYDDGHSHVTIRPADWWLNRFKMIASEIGLVDEFDLLCWSYRDNGHRPVAILSNLRSLPYP